MSETLRLVVHLDPDTSWHRFVSENLAGKFRVISCTTVMEARQYVESAYAFVVEKDVSGKNVGDGSSFYSEVADQGKNVTLLCHYPPYRIGIQRPNKIDKRDWCFGTPVLLNWLNSL